MAKTQKRIPEAWTRGVDDLFVRPQQSKRENVQAFTSPFQLHVCSTFLHLRALHWRETNRSLCIGEAYINCCFVIGRRFCSERSFSTQDIWLADVCACVFQRMPQWVNHWCRQHRVHYHVTRCTWHVSHWFAETANLHPVHLVLLLELSGFAEELCRRSILGAQWV